jgi:porin
MGGDLVHASFHAAGRCFGVSAAGCSGSSILSRFCHALRGLLTFAAAALSAPAAEAAQNWLGPNNSCAPDMLLGDWGGLRTRLADYGVSFGVQQQSEVWGNLTGGLSRGGAYDGLLTASLCVDLAAASKSRWAGGRFFASGFQIQGVGPTPLRVGALQTISNIEATASTKLYDLWFEQQLFDGKFSLRVGQEGANDEMMLTEYGALFLNSSFGFPALLALDLPSGGPNYPLATPFVRLNVQASDEITLVGAVYNGDPAPPGTGNPQLRDRHGTAFRLNDHTLSFAELWYSPSLGPPATYKLGMWVATGQFADPVTATDDLSLANPASSGQPLLHATDHAVYAVIDQMIWKKPNTETQGLSLFVQVMHAPENRNLSDLFIEGGLNWKGIIPGRSHDVAGVAVTHAGIGASAVHFSQDAVFFTGLGSPYSPGETIVEATYRARLTPSFKVQPDLQYVVNPGAGIPTPQNPAPLKNALVLGVRVTVDF